MEPGWRQETAFLALVLWASGSSQEGGTVFGADFNSKAERAQRVANPQGRPEDPLELQLSPEYGGRFLWRKWMLAADRLLTEDPFSPKCFSQQLEDLACFWETSEPPRKGESQTTYTFLYKFEEETSLKPCQLNVERTMRNTTRHICIFQRQAIAAFTPIEVKVLEGNSTNNSSLYSRTIWLDKVVFLDPPSNLTVRLMELPGQLNVSWQAPNLAFLGTSIRYEVNISLKGFKSQRVEIANGRTYCLITNLKGQTRYTLVVRAKPDGVSYDGYWSAWSQPVTVTTINNLDPLILTLSVILVMIVLLLAFIALMSHRRFLKKKIWPAIPTPEREFKDLFTIYKGNFQLWLGHQSTYPWWSHNSFYLEEQPFLLEILSECESRKVDCPPSLPPKARDLVGLPHPPDVSQDEYLVLDEDVAPSSPGRDSSPLSKGDPADESPDVALSAVAGTRDPSQASSSFEYTVFDPSSECLSPCDRQTEPQLKGSYQMVSDSGISADYSPVGSNVGQASLYTNLCDGGIQPQAFLPAYIMCS